MFLCGHYVFEYVCIKMPSMLVKHICCIKFNQKDCLSVVWEIIKKKFLNEKKLSKINTQLIMMMRKEFPLKTNCAKFKIIIRIENVVFVETENLLNK